MIHKKNQRLSIKQKEHYNTKNIDACKEYRNDKNKNRTGDTFIVVTHYWTKKDCSYTITNMKWTFRRARVKQRINYKHD